ncbi:MAG: metal ABC transporter ATP-binding protein [Verrucomicrobiota bacterium]
MTDVAENRVQTGAPPTSEKTVGREVIRVRDLDLNLEGRPVLRKVDLTVSEYEFLSVVGPNGGGKTTLIKLILGLLQPSSGTVRVFGKPPESVRRRIGYLPQYVHFDPLFPITVRDVVMMGRLGMGRRTWRFGKADREAALRAMQRAHVEDLSERSFDALSGGQRQRVLLARALATEPELLLLDEPTANVDTVVENRLFETLRELNAHMTILVVSHDLGVVSSAVTRVICVKKTVRVHPTSELTGDLVRELYGADIHMVQHDHNCAAARGME